MSGPQGYDPTRPWQPQPPSQRDEQRGAEQQWQQSPSGWQPSAYPPSQYSQYQQPASYPAAPQHPPAGYPQPGQYGQPGQQSPYGQYGPSGQYGQYPQQPGQYGQYPQQPGQYGQYPQQPGQYGPPGQAGRPSKSMISVALVSLAVIALLVLVLGFWKPGFFVTTKLDLDKAQAGVQRVLSDETSGYGAKNVKDVKCNSGESPVVKKGDTFNCEVSIDGTKRQVTVTFQDNSGTYEVGRPK